MGNRTPQELTPYVFNWKYDGATLKSHYLQAAAGAKDWLREAHKSDEFVVESLCSAFASSSHDKDDADSEIKVVLSQAALDEWHYKFEFHQLPRNFTAMEFHVLPDDFKDSSILCPSSATAGRGNKGCGNGAWSGSSERQRDATLRDSAPSLAHSTIVHHISTQQSTA